MHGRRFESGHVVGVVNDERISKLHRNHVLVVNSELRKVLVNLCPILPDNGGRILLFGEKAEPGSRRAFNSAVAHAAGGLQKLRLEDELTKILDLCFGTEKSVLAWSFLIRLIILIGQ